MNLVRVGGAIQTKVQIINGGDGCFPDELVANPGDVLEIQSINTFSIVVRHHNYEGTHGGFYLLHKEYKVVACLCSNTKRPAPCWCSPVPVTQEDDWCLNCFRYLPCGSCFKKPQNPTCRVCGHLVTCHGVNK